MPLTTVQHEASQGLLDDLDSPEILGCSDAGNLFHNLQHDEVEDTWPDQDLVMDPDDDILEDSNTLLEDEDSFLAANAGESRSLTANAIQKSILQLLLSLYTHLPTQHDGKFYSPILRFIVLMSLKKDGTWLLSRQITQIMSVLLFTGRLLMMVIMHREVVRCPDTRFARFDYHSAVASWTCLT
jgi:hypothetical protein